MYNTVNQLKEYLINYNIKPSTIRLKILEYLLNNPIHPTADDIYKSLLDQIPTISKTSVYNTMDLFADKGVVKVISLDGKVARYDINTCLHGHFKCRVCERVFDFPFSSKIPTPKELNGFVINEIDINFYGVCQNCKKIKEGRFSHR
nr:transcriptional repressor [Clostridia bacterium]